MDYYEGFCFRLDYYNKIWWNYYETLNTNTVSTAQIVRYFIKELGSQFEKIYKDFIDVDSVSNKSLELSRQVIQDWDEKYENGLYKINSVCCVAIPGFIYKTAPTDCHTLYDSINDKIDSFGLLSDEEYIELIEKIFMMRFGMKPQDSKSKEVEFFIPAMLPVFSASLDKKKVLMYWLITNCLMMKISMLMDIFISRIPENMWGTLGIQKIVMQSQRKNFATAQMVKLFPAIL